MFFFVLFLGLNFNLNNKMNLLIRTYSGSRYPVVPIIADLSFVASVSIT